MSDTDCKVATLPTEMLCEVFDWLTFDDQFAAMRTCSRWTGILADERFTRHRRMCLNHFNLGSENPSKLKQYRSFTIRDSMDDNYLEHLREFLFTKEVSENLEELRLDMLRFTLCDIFAGDTKIVMPNLKKITILPNVMTSVGDVSRCKLVAPNLKVVELQDSNSTLYPFLQLLSDQVEDLTLKCLNVGDFLTATRRTAFTNLRSLTLEAIPTAICRPGPFTEAHLQMFDRLTYLKVVRTNNTLFFAFESFFNVMRNLETLIIEDDDLSGEAVSEIGNMKNLKELHLYCKIFSVRPIRKLVLPELERLLVCQTLLPLEHAPKLRKLYILNHPLCGSSYIQLEHETVVAFFQVFNEHLEILQMIQVNLNSSLVTQICNLTKLRKLTLEDVLMSEQALEKITNFLKELKEANFKQCHVIKKEIAASGEENGIDEPVKGADAFKKAVKVDDNDFKVDVNTERNVISFRRIETRNE